MADSKLLDLKNEVKYKYIIVGEMKVAWYYCWFKNLLNEKSLTVFKKPFALSVTWNFRHKIPNAFWQELSTSFTVNMKLFHSALGNQFSYLFISVVNLTFLK